MGLIGEYFFRAPDKRVSITNILVGSSAANKAARRAAVQGVDPEIALAYGTEVGVKTAYSVFAVPILYFVGFLGVIAPQSWILHLWGMMAMAVATYWVVRLHKLRSPKFDPTKTQAHTFLAWTIYIAFFVATLIMLPAGLWQWGTAPDPFYQDNPAVVTTVPLAPSNLCGPGYQDINGSCLPQGYVSPSNLG